MPIAVLIIAVVTALLFGLFVFLLFPKSKPKGAAAAAAEAEAAGAVVMPEVGPVQQAPLGARLVAAAPRGYIAWLEKQIVFAGRPAGWTPNAIAVWKILLPLSGIVFGLLVLSRTGGTQLMVLLVFFAVILLFFLPDVLINSRAHDRQEAIKKALPDLLDQMTIAVEAGLGFDAAMVKAARGSTGPLADELVRVQQDMAIGRTRRDSFHELEKRTSVEELRRFVRAVVQADAYGIALGDVLRVQAGEMRLKRRQRAEEQAQKVTVKILFPLIFCLLPVLFIVLMTPALINILDTFAVFG
ncbi:MULTISPECIES: type II secretion system F family protein [unclassified Microbacterium]|uniref:type II secretion system F family protein n=1 Tax=unclassified Microbacterium TaxID=2609290 RepID=UPI0012F7BF02|nr:type II secretion system F family protein [Microbacterium sp. MAH-37]MVQ43715.1 type II secretion system F family protein [Microbacterium sp. MAH-37]